jgi:hypothetical protein
MLTVEPEAVTLVLESWELLITMLLLAELDTGAKNTPGII